MSNYFFGPHPSLLLAFSSPFAYVGLHTSHHDGGAGLVVSSLTEAQLGGGRCTRSVFHRHLHRLYPHVSLPHHINSPAPTP